MCVRVCLRDLAQVPICFIPVRGSGETRVSVSGPQSRVPSASCDSDKNDADTDPETSGYTLYNESEADQVRHTHTHTHHPTTAPPPTHTLKHAQTHARAHSHLTVYDMS